MAIKTATIIMLIITSIVEDVSSFRFGQATFFISAQTPEKKSLIALEKATFFTVPRFVLL